MNQALIKKIFSFGVVGGIGFAVDAGILTLLSSKMGVNVYVSRLISFTVAVFVTWMLNRQWVFKANGPRTTTKINEYLSYLSVQGVGALINLGIFSVSLFYFPSLKAYPVIPLAFGSAGGMLFNFFGSHLWVFRKRQT